MGKEERGMGDEGYGLTISRDLRRRIWMIGSRRGLRGFRASMMV